MNLAEDVDFEALAAEADDLSGAEIESLTTEAGMFAVRDERTEINMEDFHSALQKITDEESATEPVAFQ